MPKEIILDGDKIINATDWEAKSKEIIRRLDEELFASINQADCYKYKYDKEGNEIAREKRAVKKGEIMPTISANQVATKLNRLMRIYMPMTLDEALSLEPQEYLTAYGYYLDVICHIETYTTFVPDKQSYCAFVNITDDIYNELFTNPAYAGVFKSIDNGVVSELFQVAQSGLIDNKTTVAKLQTKDAGHNLVKNPESLTIVQNNKVDTAYVDNMYKQFISMAQKPKQIGKGDKKK